MLRYLYIILSRDKNKVRFSFYLPWVGVFIGSLFLFLVDGIMVGMEEKIFSTINKYTEGYKIENLLSSEFNEFRTLLEDEDIPYSIESSKDVVLSYNKNHSIVKLLIDHTSKKSNNIAIGNGIAEYQEINLGDIVTLLSPLDISIQSMEIPRETFFVDSIYKIPVVDFDRLYIYANDSTFNSQLNLNKYFIVNEDIDNKKINLLKARFDEITLNHWADEYKELSAAIDLEKYMYKSFAYLLILISCLGIFTTSNHSIVNKAKIFAILNVLGLNNRIIRRKIFYLMGSFTLFSTALAFILTKILVHFQLLDPLLNSLFPNELFYDFEIRINFLHALYITLLNIGSIILSIYIPLKIIDSTETVKILNKRI